MVDDGADDTRTAILRHLREGPAQASAIAAAVGVETSATRRHLEILLAEGAVAATRHVEGPGRPKKLYALTASGEERFPRDYRFLLEALLAKVEAVHGRDEVLRLLDAVAKDVGAGLAEEPDRGRRLTRLARSYDDLGFEASLEEDDAGAAIVQRNCILLQTARADPSGLCDCFDEGIIRTAFPDADVTLTECMATGDARCRHRITFPRQESAP